MVATVRLRVDHIAAQINTASQRPADGPEGLSAIPGPSPDLSPVGIFPCGADCGAVPKITSKPLPCLI
jgi:hypothetical protein